MQPEKTLQAEGANLLFKCSTELFAQYQLHCHGFYELYYFVCGDIQYMVEGVTYTPAPGDLLLLRPGLVHGVRNCSNAPYGRYAFHFTPALLPAENRELLLSPFHQEQIFFTNFPLTPALDGVLACEGLPKSLHQISLSCRFQALLTGLFPLLQEKVLVPDGLSRSIAAYLDEHLSEPLHLEEIAHAFFISKSQLNRIFKKDLNLTVGGYISLKRCAMARQRMLQGETAAASAAACGFLDYSTFFRTYKRYMGLAPTQSVTHAVTGLAI